MKSQALFIAFVMSACASDDGTSAQPDAQVDAPKPPPDAPFVCSPGDPSSCSAETICIAQKCEPAFGRIYQFHDAVVTVAEHNMGGGTWDIAGGAPDPFLVIKLNDVEILHTASKGDTFSATFTNKVDHEIIAGSKLDLTIYDDDFDGPDTILHCVIDPLSAELLREGGVSCAGVGNQSASSLTLPISVK
jgi:hypothetical protein